MSTYILRDKFGTTLQSYEGTHLRVDIPVVTIYNCELKPNDPGSHISQRIVAVVNLEHGQSLVRLADEKKEVLFEGTTVPIPGTPAPADNVATVPVEQSQLGGIGLKNDTETPHPDLQLRKTDLQLLIDNQTLINELPAEVRRSLEDGTGYHLEIHFAYPIIGGVEQRIGYKFKTGVSKPLPPGWYSFSLKELGIPPVTESKAYRQLQDKYNKLETKLNVLWQAVHDLYYAAFWRADRPVDAKSLWEKVRDAAGFIPGLSPIPIEKKPSKFRILEFPAFPYFNGSTAVHCLVERIDENGLWHRQYPYHYSHDAAEAYIAGYNAAEYKAAKQ